MHLKRNLLSIAIGAAFIVTQFVTPVIAADTAQDSSQQHQSGQHSGHSHSDTKSSGEYDHGHQCASKMSSVDTNKDGKISKEEFMKHHEAMFDKKDTNKDGFLDEAERRSMKEKMHKHDHGKQQNSGDHAHGDAKK
ncbi:MAG: calcium-binding protein [Nitrosomonas sp.]|uniref:calcium-binding protein n=1 Tax=Nitrosomonas sp. TaxID=42353 RepID=UPI0025E333E4|nr:calcium-binding protein [Nitrosomonas sp.]MBY0475971.1 calcium-binding protein [Nitrosomonas sp.]